MKSIKIFFLDHAPYEGGAEMSLVDLLKNLDKKRFEAILVCPKNAPYARELTNAGTRVIDFHYHWTAYKFFFPLLYDVVRLIGLIRREKPRIIHTNTRVTNILGGLIKIVKNFSLFPPSPRLRRAGTFHFSLLSHIRDRDPLSFWKFKLIGNADLLIANSQKTKEFLVEGGILKKKIKVIYNGIDLKKFTGENFNRAEAKKSLGISENQKVITTIGQIYPRKGIPYLIKAIKSLALDKTLFIVGQDPTPNQKNLTFLKSLIKRLNLENEVCFLGYCNNIPEILTATDVFALPSLEEPFGRVLVEAMAMKTPVVATNVGGIPEIVENGKSGFLVPPKNPSALAEKLLILLESDKMREEFGLAGRKIVEEKFTLEKHVEQIQKLYEEIHKSV